MRGRTIRTPKKREKFLEALRNSANVTLAAREAGIGRSSAFEWREADSAFAKDWDDALQEGLDLLEGEVKRRAFDGVKKPIFYKGAEVSTVQEYSDTLAMFYLKGYRPDRFRDRFELEIKDAREKVELAIAEFVRRTGRSREDAIQYLKPHIPQISELVH